jgi:hypothetical protein
MFLRMAVLVSFCATVRLGAQPVQKVRASCPASLLKAVVKAADFREHRSLAEYVTLLGESFWINLSNLQPSSHWIDGGAGQFRAITQYLDAAELAKSLSYEFHQPGAYNGMVFTKRSRTPLEDSIAKYFQSFHLPNAPPSYPDRAAVTGVSCCFDSWNVLPYKRHRGKLKVIKGTIESLSRAELEGSRGPADLITDVMGAFAYSPYPDKVIRKYLSRLKENASLHIYVGRADDPGNLTTHVVVTRKGRISLIDWVANQWGNQFSGLQENTLFDLPKVYSFSLRGSTRNSSPRVALKLTEVIREETDKNGKIRRLDPPRRIFQEVLD